MRGVFDQQKYIVPKGMKRVGNADLSGACPPHFDATQVVFCCSAQGEQHHETCYM